MSQTQRTLRPPTNEILARERLGFYGHYVHGYTPARHHWRWIDALTDERHKRLLIITPPGHAKSTWVSQIYACWWVGRNPEGNMIMVSNTVSQASLFLGVVKDTIERNARFHAVFPEIQPDPRRGWTGEAIFVKRQGLTNKDATVFATGTGGVVVGRRADLMLIDDPLDQDNTSTELQRRKVKQWFRQTLMTRIKPDGRVVVILTRWHEDDLAGDLMSSGEYEVIHMKAIDDQGQPLWPELWPLERLEAKRQEMGTALFECMYQGDPTSLGGDIFKREWFQNYIIAPEGLRVYQAWDLAISQKDSADYTVGVTVGVDKDQRAYILNVVRGRWTFQEQQEQMTIQAEQYNPVAIGIESVAYQAAAFQEAVRRGMWPFVELKPERDKVSRARLLAARAEANAVFAPHRATWWNELESEVMAFPNGRHDDQVDALVYALLLARGPADRMPLPGVVMLGGQRQQARQQRAPGLYPTRGGSNPTRGGSSREPGRAESRG